VQTDARERRELRGVCAMRQEDACLRMHHDPDKPVSSMLRSLLFLILAEALAASECRGSESVPLVDAASPSSVAATATDSQRPLADHWAQAGTRQSQCEAATAASAQENAHLSGSARDDTQSLQQHRILMSAVSPMLALFAKATV